jgi:hypothetical protein
MQAFVDLVQPGRMLYRHGITSTELQCTQYPKCCPAGNVLCFPPLNRLLVINPDFGWQFDDRNK